MSLILILFRYTLIKNQGHRGKGFFLQKCFKSITPVSFLSSSSRKCNGGLKSWHELYICMQVNLSKHHSVDRCVLILIIYISTSYQSGCMKGYSYWLHLYSPLSLFIQIYFMITSSNGNIFRVTGPLLGEFTGHWWTPLTKASDAELWCFLWINGRVNNSEAGDLRRHRTQYDVTIMFPKEIIIGLSWNQYTISPVFLEPVIV